MAKRGRPTNEERAARAAVQADASMIVDTAGNVQSVEEVSITREMILADDVSLAPANEAARLFPLVGERVLPDLGLLPEHVAAHRLDGASVILVTRGGVKLRWPDDIERAKTLTQSQKDGQFPGGKNPNSKAWHEPAEANPALAAVLAAQQKKGEGK